MRSVESKLKNNTKNKNNNKILENNIHVSLYKGTYGRAKNTLLHGKHAKDYAESVKDPNLFTDFDTERILEQKDLWYFERERTGAAIKMLGNLRKAKVDNDIYQTKALCFIFDDYLSENFGTTKDKSYANEVKNLRKKFRDENQRYELFF